MSEIENMPPTSHANSSGPAKADLKQPTKSSASKGKTGSDRKKLQTLQPCGKNQTLLVGADGQLRIGGGSSGKKEAVKVFVDPEVATPERKAGQAETAVQAVTEVSEGCSQVEKADVAQAKAEEQMYGGEQGEDYWRDLAEKRREALEVSLLENEELHTSLLEVEEEKEAVEKERDNLKELAKQAEELSKIVKSLVDDDDTEEEEEEEGEEEAAAEKKEEDTSPTDEKA